MIPPESFMDRQRSPSCNPDLTRSTECDFKKADHRKIDSSIVNRAQDALMSSPRGLYISAPERRQAFRPVVARTPRPRRSKRKARATGARAFVSPISRAGPAPGSLRVARLPITLHFLLVEQLP